ncbi:MAG: NADH-quinone oxidoreductase subunit C [Melioribacteraceae bacterium]|jgi:NADH-quinone oxidoreductase subunit C|nr:NADH-quinone oxidoreductase subunit C [Melioribacteraceae bacterium]
MNLKESIVNKINSIGFAVVKDVTEFRDDFCVKVDSTKIIEIANLLKYDEELKFELCEDVTAIDWATRKNRFTVVYHVLSLKNNFRLRIKADLEGTSNEIESVVSVWGSANWYERETWDMYGIKFINHPDLRRMYMPEEFEYHPLRKEFPVMGIPGSVPLPKQID